jgi:hypothetical protein
VARTASIQNHDPDYLTRSYSTQTHEQLAEKWNWWRKPWTKGQAHSSSQDRNRRLTTAHKNLGGKKRAWLQNCLAGMEIGDAGPKPGRKTEQKRWVHAERSMRNLGQRFKRWAENTSTFRNHWRRRKLVQDPLTETECDLQRWQASPAQGVPEWERAPKIGTCGPTPGAKIEGG